ncbi:MAG TPA: nickel-responsive transcriptional regulator NikR [Candidatus Acidoferrales bacterium]|nr:nickel-responsive transcriptional regulator NikR [Candidatus Acidoferrales bacterium]
MKNGQLIRFGVSMEDELLEMFDKIIDRRGYTNRSEAIRDFVREKIVEEGIHDANSLAFGVLSFVYDHHVRELEGKLTDFQHEHFKSIVSTSHIHIDHDNCLEVIILKDKAGKISEIADKMLSYKGVKHGKLSLTLTGKEF